MTDATSTRPSTRLPSTAYEGAAVDLVPGRLRGFRRWKILPSDPDLDRAPRLASITANTVWPWTPVVEARCLRKELARDLRYTFDDGPEHAPDDVPYVGCTCGIYARHAPFTSEVGPGEISGVIEAWGRVEIGQLGFRARRARLVALAEHWSWYATAMAAGLGNLYNVPVFDTPREMVDAFPPGDVSNLTRSVPPEPVTPMTDQCNGCYAQRAGGYSPHHPTCMVG
jgi:hypothetical protein